MKRYKFRFNGMWGRCKHCFQLLDDTDHIYGNGYCLKCDCKLAIRRLLSITK